MNITMKRTYELKVGDIIRDMEQDMQVMEIAQQGNSKWFTTLANVENKMIQLHYVFTNTMNHQVKSNIQPCAACGKDYPEDSSKYEHVCSRACDKALDQMCEEQGGNEISSFTAPNIMNQQYDNLMYTVTLNEGSRQSQADTPSGWSEPVKFWYVSTTNEPWGTMREFDYDDPTAALKFYNNMVVAAKKIKAGILPVERFLPMAVAK